MNIKIRITQELPNGDLFALVDPADLEKLGLKVGDEINVVVDASEKETELTICVRCEYYRMVPIYAVDGHPYRYENHCESPSLRRDRFDPVTGVSSRENIHCRHINAGACSLYKEKK